MSKAGLSIGVITAPGQTALTRNPSTANRLAEGAHDPEHPALGGAVGGQERAPEQPLDGRDEDDGRTRPGGPEGGDQGLGQHHRRPEVDVDGPVPGGVVDVVHLHGPRHAGGVDQATQGAECRGGGRHLGGDGRRVRHVDGRPVGGHPVPLVAEAVAVSSAPAASMSQTPTGRPTSASARADWRPMPEPPPVTSTPLLGWPSRSAVAGTRLARTLRLVCALTAGGPMGGHRRGRRLRGAGRPLGRRPLDRGLLGRGPGGGPIGGGVGGWGARGHPGSLADRRRRLGDVTRGRGSAGPGVRCAGGSGDGGRARGRPAGGWCGRARRGSDR